jgi:hypothetical protein
MDLPEAKRILCLVAGDTSMSGRAWEGQEESAGLILNELARLEKEAAPVKNRPEDFRVIVTVVVDGGNVQGVYTTLGTETPVEIEMLDFDNARADSDDPDALEKIRKRLLAVENEQRQIY